MERDRGGVDEFHEGIKEFDVPSPSISLSRDRKRRIPTMARMIGGKGHS